MCYANRPVGYLAMLLVLALLRGSYGTSTSSRLTASATNRFVDTKTGLQRLATLQVAGPAAQAGGRLRISVDGQAVQHKIDGVPMGDNHRQVTFPPIEKAAQAKLELVSGAETLTTTMAVPAARKWKIYVVPTVHTDIGYTHHQSVIPEIHNDNTDRAIELCGKSPHYKYQVECAWSAQMYERDRGPTQMAKLAELARQRRIGVSVNYVNMLTGLCSAEELTRFLYTAARLARRYGIPFESATQNDTPSYVWSLPTVLHRAGVKYLSVGVNNNATRAPILRGGIDRKSPFWWEGPDGSKVLTWYARGYVDAHQVGLTENLAAVENKLAGWLAGWARRDDYPYDAILIHGAYGDNRTTSPALAETIAAWNARYAYPKITLATFPEFFAYIESRFGSQLPTVRGCGGCYWEDGAASSARQTAINRDNHHRIVAAETIQAVLSTLEPDRAYPHALVGRTWDNILLYDEHTWGSRRWGRDPRHKSVVTQWATKAAFATDARRDTKALLDDGLSLLTRRTRGKGRGALVFNPLSWDRTDVVHVTLPPGTRLLDPDGRSVACQTMSTGAQGRRVCFLAENVPGVGYKRYALVDGPREAASGAPAGEKPQRLENRFYRVALDARSGGIASIIDKQTGQELVDTASPYKLGEVIYASGGKGTTAIEWNKSLPPAKFEFSRPDGAAWRITRQGKVLTSVRSTTRTKMLPEVGVEATLYESLKRLDLTVHLNKELTYDMEAVYVAFPFAADKPRFRLEIGGGWVDPGRDMLPGACLDWFCVQNAVTLHTGQAGIGLSPVHTPLISLCAINTGKWLQKLDLTNGTVFAYVMNNYWLTNYKPGQGGRTAFVYSITSDKTVPTPAATRHGWGVGQPLIAVLAEGSSKPTPPGRGDRMLPATGSFCRISSPDVVLTAFKRAEENDGLVLRFMEVAGKPTSFEFSCDLLGMPKAAWRCDSVERKRAPLQVSNGTVKLRIDAFGIETIRLRL